MKATIDPLDRMIGARIRMRRAQLGLTQTQLGEHLKVSFQQVQKYEKGINRVAASRIAAIAVFLKVSNTYFFSGEVAGNDEGPPAVDERFVALMEHQDREARRLLIVFSQIKGAKNRRKVVAIVEAVAAAFAEASDTKACG